MNGPHPIATYRVQLSGRFPFSAAREIVPYLAGLGVSHLYASPIAMSVAGSTHGYDVVDPTRIDDELGAREGFDALVAVLGEHGMGLLVDVVPNHMSTHESNPYWFDVLEHGYDSRWAHMFDFDLTPEEGSTRPARILVPILDDPLDRAIERGDVRVERDGDRMVVAHGDRRFPLSPTSVASIVEPIVDRRATVGLIDPVGVVRRAFEDTATRRAVDARLDAISRDPVALRALLDHQHYRLASWRAANREIGHRRFFDIDALAGVRVEAPDVFEIVDRLVIDGVRSGAISGVRIDHIDGLRDPHGYLCRLRERIGDAWIVVEKILEGRERLPTTWPVDGTTGYEFASRVNGLFVDPRGEERLSAFATGSESSWPEMLRSAKEQILSENLAAEVERLTDELARVAAAHRPRRDVDRTDLRDATVAVLIGLDVYRTYVIVPNEPSGEDVAVLAAAVTEARIERADLDDAMFDLLHGVLAADAEFVTDADADFRERFQQVSGALMAKAKEDTAFYRWPRLLSLTEVGNDPSVFGTGVADFHEFAAERQRLWPLSLNALTTHDSKRSEDVRSRLDVLSEIPDVWIEHVTRWFGAHDAHAAVGDTMRYYVYQTLVGAHPLTRDRAQAHFLKAARESKSETSWIEPDDEFERSLAAFVDALFDDPWFARELASFADLVTEPGRIGSLAQKVLQLLAPGVPDIYQGQEVWDLSLTDPDNRRAVDFSRRAAVLAGVRSSRSRLDGSADGESGTAKMFVTERGLSVRRAFPEAFGPEGAYEALEVSGPARDHVVAFCRSGDVVAVVPRLIVSLPGSRRRTRVHLPPGNWLDVLDPATSWKGRVDVRDLLGSFPVAMLVRRDRPMKRRLRS